MTWRVYRGALVRTLWASPSTGPAVSIRALALVSSLTRLWQERVCAAVVGLHYMFQGVGRLLVV